MWYSELIALSLVVAVPQTGADDAPPSEISLFDFLRPDAAEDWNPVHDRVMGGRSSGGVEGTGGELTFSGEVSLENNGGFASFRVRPKETDLAEYHGLRIEVLGGGQNWKLTLRTEEGREDLNWQAPFRTTDGAWTTIDIPFSAFTPVFRGRFVPEAGPLDPSVIESVGLLIGDKQAGEFDLVLRELSAWRVDPAAGEPGSMAAAVERTQTLADLFGLRVDVAELLSTLQWKERLLVVAEPLEGDDLGIEASKQIGRLLARPESLALRDLRIVHLLGDRATRVAGRTIGPEATGELRRQWALPRPRFAVVLIGKDGDVKERWEEVVDADEVFDTVDDMPMARDELAERR
jgi:monofunctional biosynthetic peptidoglycan transglycosylase